MSGLTVEEYYQRLKAIQEPKGYFFNADLTVTYELLEGLLANKERYGYMLPMPLGFGRPPSRQRHHLPLCLP